MAFCADTKIQEYLQGVKIQNPTPTVQGCTYLMIVLSQEEAKLVKRHRSGQATDEPLSRNAALALEYGMKAFPRIIVCDWYGNVLGRVRIAELVGKAGYLIKRMLKQQVSLAKTLTRQFESVKKRYQKELEKGEFTASTIFKLNRIGGYRGYAPAKQAKKYLREINRAAEKELAKICAADDGSDAASLIRVLKKFQSKYKNMPAGQAAEEKIIELEGKE